MTDGSLRENILAAQVIAALQGHDLGPFEPTEEPGVPKFQAFCHSCGKSVYVSNVTVYSILGDSCPG